MDPYFENFIRMIPKDIHLGTKSYVSEQIAIFKPKKFVTGQRMYLEDYNFVLFHSAPPATRIGNKEYWFQKGCLVSMEPGMDVTVLPYGSESEARFISICIDRSFFQSISLEAIGKENVCFKNIENAYSHQLLDITGCFCDEVMNHGNNYPRMLQSIATQMVFQILRDSGVQSSMNRNRSSEDSRYIKQAIEYMESYYDSNITVNDICGNIYFSPAHFKRMFKYYTGQTPHRYLIGIRIQKAKKLLKKDEYSIAETAKACGFINVGHFSTAFKKIEGVSPSEYKGRIFY